MSRVGVSVFLEAGVHCSVLGAGHSRLMWLQFLPMLLSMHGFRIGIIIALCHISGICPVKIDRLKTLVG